MSKFLINKLYIELTNKCNLNCKHCYNSSNDARDEEMHHDGLFCLLFRIKEYSKISRVIVSGGEVSIYPYIKECLNNLCAMELPFTMITNGVVFPADLYEFFVDSKNQVQVSLEGPSAIENDYIRGEGSFSKALMTTKRLVDNRVSTFFRFSITSLNYNKIEDMILLALNNGIKMVTFSNLFPYGRCKDNIDLYVNDDELITSLALLEKCKKKYSDRVFIDTPNKVMGGCPIVNKTESIGINARIDLHGNLYLCQMFNNAALASGSIIDSSIESVLLSKQNERIIKLINAINEMRNECNKCFAFPICKYGCPAIGLSNNYIWGGDGVCGCRKHIMKEYISN